MDCELQISRVIKRLEMEGFPFIERCFILCMCTPVNLKQQFNLRVISLKHEVSKFRSSMVMSCIKGTGRYRFRGAGYFPN